MRGSPLGQPRDGVALSRRSRRLGRSALAAHLTTCGVALALGLGCSSPGGSEGGSGSSPGQPPQGSGSSSGTGSAPSIPGNPNTGGLSASGGASPVHCDAPDVAPTVLRRLSALEYQLTVQDLFALGEMPSADGLPLDTERQGFRTYAEYQTMSAENLRAYLDSATRLADSLLADASRVEQVIGCDPSDATCLPKFLERFGKLAYRRPLEAIERDVLMTASGSATTDPTDQVRFLIQALLSSPNFLYRVEIGTNKEGLSTLTAYELASKLSFALWGRGPSAELLDKAAAGELDSDEGLTNIARSMLSDERSELFFAAFFQQWLGYQTLKPKTPAEAPVYADMQTETDRLMEEYAWGGGNILDALVANHTYLTPELANFYGLPAPGPDGKSEFSESSYRAHSGLLTHASLLSAKSDGDLISIRGNWLRRTFLCKSLHIPAELSDLIGESLVGLDRVGIVQERNSSGVCAECHASIDPIGIGFDQFTRSGAFDPTIDSSVFGITPALPDAPAPNQFESIGQLSTLLRAMPEVPACLTSRAFLYINGREPEAQDACGVSSASQDFEADASSFPTLLEAITKGPSFRYRRAPEPAP